MTTPNIQLLNKIAVTERLGVSDRTLEKLVRARKFPPPLRLGKQVMWAEPVVEKWLAQALAAQLAWEPPGKGRRTGAGH
jgi:prophage regulatory protein